LAGSGKQIPLHYNHSPVPKDIIGSIDPASMRETDDGLYTRGKLDLDRSGQAREVWPLVKTNVMSLSFGYLATDTFKRDDGVQELREIDLFEISIVPAPANPDTRILSYKSADPPESELERDTLSPEYRRLRDRARDEMYALLTAPLESDLEVVLEREEKRQARELRRKCDRLLLEAALDFDADLIKKIGL
jgi:HK97 family phage prohead protease